MSFYILVPNPRQPDKPAWDCDNPECEFYGDIENTYSLMWWAIDGVERYKVLCLHCTPTSPVQR